MLQDPRRPIAAITDSSAHTWPNFLRLAACCLPLLITTLGCSGSGDSADGSGGAGAVSGQTGGTSSQGGSTASGTCTSNTQWMNGDHGSPLMHPGVACITCHATKSDAPTFVIGGTVYPTSHEPNDCNGVNTSVGAVVVITDASGKAHTLPVNAAGNFYLEGGAIPLPFHAKVVVGGREQAMATAQTSGDCNSCHTQAGANAAPGRILAP